MNLMTHTQFDVNALLCVSLLCNQSSHAPGIGNSVFCRLLIMHGAFVNFKDDEGHTASDVASFAGYSVVVDAIAKADSMLTVRTLQN
jgi:ankyrin repeat protein